MAHPTPPGAGEGDEDEDERKRGRAESGKLGRRGVRGRGRRGGFGARRRRPERRRRERREEGERSIAAGMENGGSLPRGFWPGFWRKMGDAGLREVGRVRHGWCRGGVSGGTS